jgi:hypothetical protein
LKSSNTVNDNLRKLKSYDFAFADEDDRWIRKEKTEDDYQLLAKDLKIDGCIDAQKACHAAEREYRHQEQLKYWDSKSAVKTVEATQ